MGVGQGTLHDPGAKGRHTHAHWSEAGVLACVVQTEGTIHLDYGHEHVVGSSGILDGSRRFVLQVPFPGPCISHCGCSLCRGGLVHMTEGCEGRVDTAQPFSFLSLAGSLLV